MYDSRRLSDRNVLKCFESNKQISGFVSLKLAAGSSEKQAFVVQLVVIKKGRLVWFQIIEGTSCCHLSQLIYYLSLRAAGNNGVVGDMVPRISLIPGIGWNT